MTNVLEWLGKKAIEEITTYTPIAEATPVFKCSVCDSIFVEPAYWEERKSYHSWCVNCADSFKRIDFTGTK